MVLARPVEGIVEDLGISPLSWGFIVEEPRSRVGQPRGSNEHLHRSWHGSHA